MEIERLNELMFDAEGQQKVERMSWEEFLADALVDDFILRRSAANKRLEDKATFLDAIREAPPTTRTILTNRTRKWVAEPVGVITCVVEVTGRPEQFTNTRVFTAGGRFGWRCHWWQVTASEAEGSTVSR